MSHGKGAMNNGTNSEWIWLQENDKTLLLSLKLCAKDERSKISKIISKETQQTKDLKLVRCSKRNVGVSILRLFLFLFQLQWDNRFYGLVVAARFSFGSSFCLCSLSIGIFYGQIVFFCSFHFNNLPESRQFRKLDRIKITNASNKILLLYAHYGSSLNK